MNYVERLCNFTSESQYVGPLLVSEIYTRTGISAYLPSCLSPLWTVWLPNWNHLAEFVFQGFLQRGKCGVWTDNRVEGAVSSRPCDSLIRIPQAWNVAIFQKIYCHSFRKFNYVYLVLNYFIHFVHFFWFVHILHTCFRTSHELGGFKRIFVRHYFYGESKMNTGKVSRLVSSGFSW